MKITYKVHVLVLLFVTLIGCHSQRSKPQQLYCGYDLTSEEYAVLSEKANAQRSVIYDSDSLWSIYDQVSDTLRQALPDSVDFEIFLNTLDENHFSIIVIAPRNQAYFETLACTFMHAKITGNIPNTRILCMYSYTNPDGSGETPFEFAVRNKK